jgi:hypothetical protein
MAPAVWLTVLGGVSLAGSLGLAYNKPRLAQRFISKIE